MSSRRARVVAAACKCGEPRRHEATTCWCAAELQHALPEIRRGGWRRVLQLRRGRRCSIWNASKPERVLPPVLVARHSNETRLLR